MFFGLTPVQTLGSAPPPPPPPPANTGDTHVNNPPTDRGSRVLSLVVPKKADKPTLKAGRWFAVPALQARGLTILTHELDDPKLDSLSRLEVVLSSSFPADLRPCLPSPRSQHPQQRV